MLDLNILVDIPDDDEVRKSANLKVPVIMKKKDSPAASAQIKLAKQIAGPDITEFNVKKAAKKGNKDEKNREEKTKDEKNRDEKKGGKFRLFGK
jgi:septum formation inhibitor-activating ATPase MinD